MSRNDAWMSKTAYDVVFGLNELKSELEALVSPLRELTSDVDDVDVDDGVSPLGEVGSDALVPVREKLRPTYETEDGGKTKGRSRSKSVTRGAGSTGVAASRRERDGEGVSGRRGEGGAP